jgi:TRAP-type C4-dicarboxylate transport system permease small subunit
VLYQTSLQPLRLSQSRTSPEQPLLRRSNRDEMTDQQRRAADSVIVLCMTVFAPLCLPPFLLGIGVLNQFVGDRANKKTKRLALAEAFVFFIIIIIAATVGITMSIKEERRANGNNY